MDPIIDAEEAARLINSSVFQEAFKDMRLQILEELAKAPVRDSEGLQFLVLSIKALDGIKTRLEHRINTGKLAAVQIERREKESRLSNLLRKVA